MPMRSPVAILIPMACACLLGACGNEPAAPPAAVVGDGGSLFPTKTIAAKPPYIVQEGCKFFLVTEAGTLSTTSDRESGPSGNATLNMGGHRMVLSNCTLAENPAGLPVY